MTKTNRAQLASVAALSPAIMIVDIHHDFSDAAQSKIINEIVASIRSETGQKRSVSVALIVRKKALS